MYIFAGRSTATHSLDKTCDFAFAGVKSLAIIALCWVCCAESSFGLIDILMTVFGKHPDVTRTMLLQAFSSRLAIGILRLRCRYIRFSREPLWAC